METLSHVDAHCPATNCTSGQPKTGGALCPLCRSRLAEDIAALPSLYEELGDSLAPAISGTERISGGGVPGLPLDARAVSIRANLIGVLASWCGAIAESHRVAPPPRTVPALAEFLVRHLGWLSEHPAAGSAADEINDLVRSGRRMLCGEHSRRIYVGPCIYPDCTGTMTALVRRSDPLIRCDADAEHCWRPEQWHALSRRRISGDGLTATDITAIWGIPLGTVYWLASEYHWRRFRCGRRVYYHLTDVTDALSRASLSHRRAGVSAHRQTS